MNRYIKITAAVAAIAVGAWVVYTVLSLAVDQRTTAEKYEEATADRSDLRHSLTEQQTKTDLLAAQVKALGEEPVVDGADKPLPPQLRYVPVPGKQGKEGKRGPAGKSATFSQVLEAVRLVIDDALARACGGSCVSTTPGPVGPAGPVGPKGDDGRGIADTWCNRAGVMVQKYTDGTTDAVEGSRCRGIALPTLPDETGAP